MVIKRKIPVSKLLFLLVLFFGYAGSSYCQLLFRPEMESENYARTGYHMYGRSQIGRSSNPRYDYFGNYLMNGVSIFHWNEEKRNSRHINPQERNSVLDKLNPVDDNELFRYYLDDLAVLSESNNMFSSRFMVGGEIRVKFSPLILDMYALNGIRWDFDFGENKLTLISSRFDMPHWISPDSFNEKSVNRIVPVYLTGGHWERKFGVFNVAANYVNTYKTDSTQSRQKNSITGTIPHDKQLLKPLQLVVKLEDGSRFDGGGPRIHDIHAVINGQPYQGDDDLLIGVSFGTWTGDLTSTRKPNDPNANLYSNRYFIDSLRMPNITEFNQDYTSNPLPSSVLAKRHVGEPVIRLSDLNEQKNDYIECNGEEYYYFWFDIPETDKNGKEVKSVEIKALVGNNYVFSLSEVYQNVESVLPDTPDIGPSGATYFETVLRSNGDVKDYSNTSWVTLEHGSPTANMLMGFKVDAEIKGFKFVGEYNRNMRFKQYSHQDAKKFRNDSEAYYLNILKEFGKFSLGAELFNLDPDYSTTFKNVDKDYKPVYDSWSTSEFYMDPTLRGSDKSAADGQYFMNLTQVLETVDDNDDKDRYPDWHIFTVVRDMNGVFPGLDKNGNNRPDTNENDNFLPDYVEPFLLYDVDPDEYDYGLDLNNNSTIDVREDDDKPDYPYDLNRKGFHVFGSYGEDLGWKYTLGYINYEKITGGGITDVKYGVAEYNKFIPFFADIKLATNVKMVKDNIVDNVYKLERHLSTTLIDSTTYAYNQYFSEHYNDDEGKDWNNSPVVDDQISEKYYDPLRYRDSYVSKSYFEMNLFNIPNLNIGMKFKYDINHQNKTSFQNKNNILDRTQIYRADYKFYFKDLLVQPQVKFMSRKFSNQDGRELIYHEEYFYPILKVEYPLTMHTTFRAGAQGFPGLNSTVRNLVNDQLDYDTRNYVIMLSNRSFYSGYDFMLNFGYEATWQKFNGIARQVFDRTDRVYFVRLIVGLEPIS